MTVQQNDFLASDGVRIGWYELGGGAGSPPILLQHGFTANTTSEWVDCGIAERLTALGRRVIGIDARGHGRSDKPHESRFYGEGRMADDVIELAATLGAPYDLVGYSMGGVIASFVASLDPNLRRVAICGVGEAVVLTGGVDVRALDARLLAAGLRTAHPETLTGMVAGFRAGALERGNDLLALAAHCDTIVPRQVGLDRIRAQTLVIAGDDDPLAIHPERLASAIPCARLQLVPGDHTAARLSPEFTTALLAFLG